MERLPPAELAALTADADVLESDSRGAKVLRLRDGGILKLFRVRRRWSSAVLRPYSQRFCENAAALGRRHVPTLRVQRRFSLDEPGLTAVLYAPLPGDTLRQRLPLSGDELQQLGAFIGELHELGIYFRSLHLGNIVRTPEGTLGLIDVADMRIYPVPLLGLYRARNFRHLLRDPRDLQRLGAEGLRQIAAGYARRCPAHARRAGVLLECANTLAGAGQ